MAAMTKRFVVSHAVPLIDLLKLCTPCRLKSSTLATTTTEPAAHFFRSEGLTKKPMMTTCALTTATTNRPIAMFEPPVRCTLSQKRNCGMTTGCSFWNVVKPLNEIHPEDETVRGIMSQ